MIINTFYETSYTGMYKITADINDSKTSFFIRKEYLTVTDFNKLDNGIELSEEETNDLLDAGLICIVELKALEYIARAEQSRFGLTRKLLAKEFDKKNIDAALTYLEQSDYLSDLRFSTAWLHTRQINHYEGRTKLLTELQSRGINKETATSAINDFFAENDEREICQKACDKFISKGKQDDKLITALLQAGFSYKLIKQILKD